MGVGGAFLLVFDILKYCIFFVAENVIKGRVSVWVPFLRDFLYKIIKVGLQYKAPLLLAVYLWCMRVDHPRPCSPTSIFVKIRYALLPLSSHQSDATGIIE